MLTIIKKLINQLLGYFGYKVQLKGLSPADRLYKALQHFEIDLLFDVGANAGQFVRELRQVGFKGRIVSFEPLSEAHKQLSQAAIKDPNWTVHSRGALGDEDGQTIINVSGNSVSSSLLDMNASHSNAALESAYTGTENIAIQKLDSIAELYISKKNRTFLKLDTQGFESQVLDGAVNTLPTIDGLLLETSLVELYKGQVLWRDIIARLEAIGFTIWSIEGGFADPRNGRTLQCDVVFFRERTSTG